MTFLAPCNRFFRVMPKVCETGRIQWIFFSISSARQKTTPKNIRVDLYFLKTQLK